MLLIDKHYDIHYNVVIWIPYSGLFSKQKISQERQNLNFEELKFRRLQILKNLVQN